MDAQEGPIAFVPPEVLDLIFAYCDIEDIKRSRLVNQTWRNAASLQIAKRICLNLEGGKRSVARNIKSILSVTEFKNVKLVDAFPKTFVRYFQNSVVSLYLKNITFDNVEDVRRLVFRTFPAMKELGLDHIRLRWGATRGNSPRASASIMSDEDPVGVITADNPKVETISICREKTTGKRCSRDIFEVMELTELIDAFGAKIKAVHIKQWDGAKEEKQIWTELFSALRRTNVYPQEITVFGLESVLPLINYLSTNGKELRGLEVNVGYNSLSVLVSSYVLYECPIESLRMDGMDLVGWLGNQLPKLTQINLMHTPLHSMEFLQSMPNLERVDHPNIQFLRELGSYTSQSVRTLCVSYSLNFQNLSHFFPNVRTLILERDGRYFILDDDMSAIGASWPNLERVEIKMLPLLGNPHPIDSPCQGGITFTQLQWLKDLKKLRSFVHRDASALRGCYDDRCATEVFFHISSLRTLQIGCCRMSDDIKANLRRNLTVFTYKRCCQ